MTFWREQSPLILASQSRARQRMLAHAGIEFTAMPADLDERVIAQSSGLSSPRDIAAMLAREKALAVSRLKPAQWVIGADQTLALGARLFSKPAGRPEAAEQLHALAGVRHELYSAVAVASGSQIVFSHVAMAGMTMRPLSEVDIEAYLDEAGQDVTSSVGAYQLEGLGVHLFDHIEGDFFTILGLPLLQLLAFLRSQQLLTL
jgi:septum formation protein